MLRDLLKLLSQMTNPSIGRAHLIMLVLFLASGLWIFIADRLGGDEGGKNGLSDAERSREASRKQLEFWVFAQTHYNEYKVRIPIFEEQHPNVKINLKNIGYDALHDMLLASFMSEKGAPELVEVEISQIGRFLKGRIEDIGFVDLTDRLKEEGWMEKIVTTRFAPWSTRGRIFGLPHDLHPVVLLYRDDVFRACGVTPEDIETWEDFLEAGKKVTKDVDGDGKPDQYALMLDGRGWVHFWPMLLQRGGGIFDEEGNVIIDSQLAVDTLQFYCDLLNKYKIADRQLTQDGARYAAMKDGLYLSVFAPDWYVGILKAFLPQLKGKWRAMPLPAWEPGGRRTSTLGGTMIGITKQCKERKLAWEFAKFAYLDEAALVNRYEKTSIIPPLKAAWKNPIFDEPDPYLGGQSLGRLFTTLATDLPPVHLNAYWAEAADSFDNAIFEAVQGSKTPAQALSDLAKKVRDAMSRDRIAPAYSE